MASHGADGFPHETDASQFLDDRIMQVIMLKQEIQLPLDLLALLDIQFGQYLRVESILGGTFDLHFRDAPRAENPDVPLVKFRAGTQQHHAVAATHIARQHHARFKKLNSESAHGIGSGRSSIILRVSNTELGGYGKENFRPPAYCAR